MISSKTIKMKNFQRPSRVFLRLRTKRSVATMVSLLALMLVKMSGAFLFGSMHDGRKCMGCRTWSIAPGIRNRGDIGSKVNLFSSLGDGTENESSDGTPAISSVPGNADLMSLDEIDWAEMDPLHEIPFDEFEDLYLRGKAKGDNSTTTNPNCDDSYESVMTEWDDSVPTLNHISLVGRVGNPPEARYFDNPLGAGTASGSNYNRDKPNMVVTMSLALPRYYSSWEREQHGIEYGQEETEWYNLEVWGVLAEFAMKNVQKGSRIGVVGAIDTDYYRNKQTDLLSTNPKVLVQDLDILESKAESDARRNSNYGNSNSNGGGHNYNSNYSNNKNSNGNWEQKEPERGPSFFANDDDDDDDLGTGGLAGGFFDPI